MTGPETPAVGGLPGSVQGADAPGTADAVLTTPRLVMRPLSPVHLPDLLSLYADPQVSRFLKPLDEEAHLRRIEETARMWATRGHGRVAIHDGRSGRFLGRGGLQHWCDHDEVEVTWALRRDAWGQGFASEAGQAWVRWGFAHLEVPYITAYIAPENTASRSVADRLGMSVLRTDVQHGRDVLVYALRRDEGTGDQARAVTADRGPASLPWRLAHAMPGDGTVD